METIYNSGRTMMQFMVLAFLIFYVFAILGKRCEVARHALAFTLGLGMELFGGKLTKSNPLLQGTSYYDAGYYDMVHWNDFSSAMLTLVHLLILNNWFVTFHAVVAVTSRWYGTLAACAIHSFTRGGRDCAQGYSLLRELLHFGNVLLPQSPRVLLPRGGCTTRGRNLVLDRSAF